MESKYQRFINFILRVKPIQDNLEQSPAFFIPLLKVYDQYFLIPKNNEQKIMPPLQFFIIYLIMSIVPTGSFFHIIYNIDSGVPSTNFASDIFFIFPFIPISYFIFYIVKTRFIFFNLLRDLMDYSRFGRPTNLDRTRWYIDVLVQFYYVYVKVGVFVFALTSTLRRSSCEYSKALTGEKNVCGMIINFWAPVNLDYFPVREITLVINIISAIYFYDFCIIIVTGLPAAIIGLHSKIDHLIDMTKAFSKHNDKNEVKKRFKICVQYHQHIILLSSRIKNYFSRFIVLIFTLAPVQLAFVVYLYISDGPAQALVFFSAISIMASIVCYSGQTLINKSTKLQEAIFNTEWYDSNFDIVTDFLIFATQAQKELRLESIGVMSLETLQKVFTRSYSYVTVFYNFMK